MPPITDAEFNRQRRARVRELLKQGLTTKQIHYRTGAHERMILRVRAKIRVEQKEKAGA